MNTSKGRLIYLILLVSGLIAALTPGWATAQQPGTDEFYLEGAQYQVLQPPVPSRAPEGQVEVVELFWYSCPHCYHLEPYLQDWLTNKPEAAYFVRVPGMLNRNWVIQARAFYAAEQLGVLEKTHVAFFKAVHEQRRRLNDEDSLAQFYAEHGVDEQKFRDAFNSFEVHTLLRQAARLNREYQITGVPAMVVAGKYLVTTSMAGGHPEMLKVVDYLVRRESAK